MSIIKGKVKHVKERLRTAKRGLKSAEERLEKARANCVRIEKELEELQGLSSVSNGRFNGRRVILNDNLIFDNAKDAAEKMGVSVTTIRSSINEGRRSKVGEFKYLDY